MPIAPLELPQQHAQVLDHDLKVLGSNPPLRLLADDHPWRQIMGTICHCTPVLTTYLTSLNTSRKLHFHCWASSRHSAKHGATNAPLVVTHVARIAASTRHDSILPEVDLAPSTVQLNRSELNNRL